MRSPFPTAAECGHATALLKDVAAAANEATDVSQALNAVLHLVCGYTGWPVGHALTRCDDGMRSTRLWYLRDTVDSAALAAFRSASEDICFKPASDLPGRVLADDRPVWIEDMGAGQGFGRAAAAAAAGLKSALAFPVRSRNEVVAVLEFFASAAAAPRADLLDVMEYLGVQLGRVFEREAAHRALRDSERNTRAVLDTASDAFIAMDAEGCVTAWNAACEQVFGWSYEEAVGRSVADLIVPPALRDAHQRGLARFVAGGEARVLGQRLELPALRRDGTEFPLEIALWSLRQGSEISFYAFARDITERKRAERDLEHRALHDSLTGLPNRVLLLDRIQQLLARRSEHPARCALLYLDIDHFKRINDSLGHEAGNELLQMIARRLEMLVRPADTVARLAADEFVVLCADAHHHRDAAIIAERLLDDLALPMELRGQSIFLTASVGIAMADENSDPETLLGAADTAMYQAKSSGRGHFGLFDESMRVQVAGRLNLESDLRHALERGELALYFQPIVCAAQGRVVALEALLRWSHPERGMVSPAQFIPVAEETGLIVPIGAWVLAEACRYAAQWAELVDGEEPLGVSVNLSGRQLGRLDLVPTVQRIISDSGIDPSRVRLGVEVTETIVMQDPTGAARSLQRLRELGVHLSIDDFGTGYSSLAYLKRFPLDTIKVDRSFVSALAEDTVDRAIVGSVLQLARALDLLVVAEGVETEAQAQVLRRLGVDRLQGFLFARPQPAEKIADLLRRQLSLAAEPLA